MLKQLASGGDTMLGRMNYKDEIEFTPQFTMMLNCNELKGVEPVDALESCEQFYCKSKFVSEEELIEGQPFLKLKDDKIKELLDKPEIINAFTLYVFENYHDSLSTPQSVKFSTDDMKADIPLTLEQVVLKHFRRSQNPNDKLFTDEIIANISDCHFDIQFHSRDLQSIILKTGIGCRSSNGKITKDSKKLSGYTNIIFIPPNDN